MEMLTQPRAAARLQATRDIQALYPRQEPRSLNGLYLSQDLRALRPQAGCYLYSNFISSLDGRIALIRADTGQMGVPERTTNARDWRLFQELAAPADAIILSSRYLQRLAAGCASEPPPFSGEVSVDLADFRATNGLPPQPVLVTLSRPLDLPPRLLRDALPGRRLIIATTDQAEQERVQRLQDADFEVYRLGGSSVDAGRLMGLLGEQGLRLLYSIAGPSVLHLWLSAGVLRRLYLTTVLRLLAGDEYATLVHGPQFDPPCDFRLAALYLDPSGPEGVAQLLQVYDRDG